MKEIAKKVQLLKPINIDKIPIEKDHYYPDAYVIDLPLDGSPDHAWQDIFAREWRISRNLWERKLYVVGNHLRLVTTTDEIEQKVDWIKQVIENTNSHIDQYNRTFQTEKELSKKIPEKRVKESIERIRETLKKALRTY